MKTTITLQQETARRIQSTKYLLGYKTADETINKVFDIVDKIVEESKSTAENLVEDYNE